MRGSLPYPESQKGAGYPLDSGAGRGLLWTGRQRLYQSQVTTAASPDSRQGEAYPDPGRTSSLRSPRALRGPPDANSRRPVIVLAQSAAREARPTARTSTVGRPESELERVQVGGQSAGRQIANRVPLRSEGTAQTALEMLSKFIGGRGPLVPSLCRIEDRIHSRGRGETGWDADQNGEVKADVEEP